jgi:hypothetical protein
MSIIGSNVLAGASGQAGGGYEIERSVRLNAPDSAYLSRTLAVAGSRTTWTWSGWIKRAKLGSSQHLFVASDFTSTTTLAILNSDDTIEFYDYQSGGYTTRLVTTQVFRDPGAWQHLQFTWDSNNGTSTDRMRIYVNGTRITTFSITTYPSPGVQTRWNNNVDHRIGTGNSTQYLDAYLADIHFIDDQALDPSSFGEFDTNGVWQPIDASGLTYGTNGFHLPFSDNSTAAALGTDSSGAGNTWSVNNFSVTAGVNNDSLTDTPTSYGTDTGAGGEVRGNYATLNPLDKASAFTLENGNLQGKSTSSFNSVRATIGMPTGKWYWEHTIETTNDMTGVQPGGAYLDSHIGTSGVGDSGVALGNTTIYNQGSSSSAGGATSNGAIVSVAFDADAGKLWFRVNGGSWFSGDPAAGTSPSVSGLTGKTYFPAVTGYNNSTGMYLNFGQRPFAYTAPSGFKALCTTNLPTGSITTSGSFTGNANADGPFVYLNGVPTAMTINSNAVTFATHADKLSNGFKLRTSSGSYNTAGSNTYSITTTGAEFKFARAQPNP